MQKTGLLLAAALLAILLAGGCTAPQQGGTPTVPTVTVTGAGPRCGFTNCHGLDPACGTNPPEACTAIYEIGDKCRQYAYCTDAGGSCTLVTTTDFDTCKRCVESCGGADTGEILLCEEKC